MRAVVAISTTVLGVLGCQGAAAPCPDVGPDASSHASAIDAHRGPTSVSASASRRSTAAEATPRPQPASGGGTTASSSEPRAPVSTEVSPTATAASSPGQPRGGHVPVVTYKFNRKYPHWPDLRFSFPASISTNGKSVAVLVSGPAGEAERFDLQRVIVQRVGQPGALEVFRLLDLDTPLMDLLWADRLAEAVPLIEANVKTANTWLARHHWRPLPICGWEPACELSLDDPGGPRPHLEMWRWVDRRKLFEMQLPASWRSKYNGPKCTSLKEPSIGATYCDAASGMVVAAVGWPGVYGDCEEPFPELRMLWPPRTSCF